MLPRVIPVLLLSRQGFVKTRQFQDPKYVGDPINAVRIFSEKLADELVFLDIDASRSKRDPNFQCIADISQEAFMPFSYGGGIQNLAAAEKILKNGAEKIILNQAFFSCPSFIRELVEEFGSATVVLCINIKKSFLGHYKVYNYCAKKLCREPFSEVCKQAEDLGVGEVIIQSVDQDGMMQGYDLSLLAQVRKCVSVPLVALGGVGQLSDLQKGVLAGADAVAAGSFFTFYGKYRAVLISYPPYAELQEVFDEKMQPVCHGYNRS